MILIDRLEAHVERHTERQTDGQMKDHITLNEKDRFRGDLENVPSVYRHKKCGGETVMPEDIIRSYLVNPMLYNDRTFCTGCNDYVPMRQCRWTETDQRLDEYMQDLQVEAIRNGTIAAPSLLGWLLMGPIVSGLIFGIIGGLKWGLKWGGIGAILGIILGLGIAIWYYLQEKQKYDTAVKRAKRRMKE